MARRNRKKKVNGYIFPTPFAGVVVLISTFALGCVWLSCRCESLGEELKALEIENELLNKRYLNEEYKWTQMKSPRNIEKALKKHNIIMIWPRRDQVIRLFDSDIFGEKTIRMAKSDPTYDGRERIVMND